MVPPKRAIGLGTFKANDICRAYVADVLSHNRLSRGPYTEMFEQQFAALHECREAVFMNSGTSALQVALATLKEVYGYKDGDEVLVPATTFIATSNIVIQNNMKPVFVDVDPYTFNMDPDQLRSRISDRSRVVIPVHLFGLPANMRRIMNIARDYDLQVIEDSCETMFASTDARVGDPRSIGSFGDMACFSTYVAHLIVGGMGGLVTTNNAKYAEICRSLMAHGRDSIYTNIDQDDTDDDALLRKMIERRYSFDRVGYSYRATELEAAIALSELGEWKSNITTRRHNAGYLKLKLKNFSRLQLPWLPRESQHSYMMFPMVLDAGIDRDTFLLYLEKHGIETRYMFPLLTQPVYKKLFPGLAEQYPVAQKLAQHGFFIGMHQGLTTEDMDYIADIIREFFLTEVYV